MADGIRGTNNDDMEWIPTTHLLDMNAKVLSTGSSSSGGGDGEHNCHHPRLAKDEAYANAIQTAWRAEISKRAVVSSPDSTISSV
eukprot:3836211-Ditylum_brightwellii.AAC.1